MTSVSSQILGHDGACPSMFKRARIDIMRLEPTNIQQIGDELAIVWNDGIESYFNLQFLRRACPCAACGGEPDVVGNAVRPNVAYSPESFEVTGFDFLVGYVLHQCWAAC